MTTAPIKQQEQQFVYDSIGRLKQSVEKRGDTGAQVYQQTYSLDRFVNRYKKAVENQNAVINYQAVEDADVSKLTNRFVPSTNVIYNDDGSVKVDAKFRNQSYWYDANGRLVKAHRNDQTNWQANSMYDALGQRVGEQENGIWTYRVYDINGQLVAEYGLPETEGRGGVSYVHTDAQGSTRAITNSNGWTNRHRIEVYVLDTKGCVAASFERLHWEEQQIVNRAIELLQEKPDKTKSRVSLKPAKPLAHGKVVSLMLGTLASVGVAFFPKCPIC